MSKANRGKLKFKGDGDVQRYLFNFLLTCMTNLIPYYRPVTVEKRRLRKMMIALCTRMKQLNKIV